MRNHSSFPFFLRKNVFRSVGLPTTLPIGKLFVGHVFEVCHTQPNVLANQRAACRRVRVERRVRGKLGTQLLVVSLLHENEFVASEATITK